MHLDECLHAAPFFRFSFRLFVSVCALLRVFFCLLARARKKRSMVPALLTCTNFERNRSMSGGYVPYMQHPTPLCYDLVHEAPAWIAAVGHAGMLIGNVLAGHL